MARYDFPNGEVDEIPFPTNPSCVLRLRREARLADKGAVARRLYEQMPEPSEDPRRFAELQLFTEVLILAEGWNLEDANGDPVPLTIENLIGLDPHDGEALVFAAHKRMEGRPMAAEGPFVNGSSRSSTVMRSSRRRSSRNSGRSAR